MKYLNSIGSCCLRACFLLVLLVQGFMVHAQVSVSGTVLDEQNRPLAGVTVKVRNATQTALTDAKGTFQLQAEKYPAVLDFTYVGYEAANVSVSSSQAIVLRMQTKGSDIDEVVVVAYGTQKKRNVIGSVAQISGEELSKAPAMNITNALAGRVPGLTTLQQSGRPGADDATLRIRGMSTYGNSAPLIIIDGVERSSFSYLDPTEIASMSFLKDAISTAPYGVRGSSGIIMITTKKGKSGAPKFSYNGAFSIGQNTRFPEFMNGPDYMEWYNKATDVDNDYLINNGFDPVPQLYAQEWIDALRNGTNTNPLFGDTDWIGLLLGKNSTSQNHSLTMTGGGEHVNYFTSVSHMLQDGVVENTNFKRYNVRSNVEAKINQYLTAGINIGLRQELGNTPGISPDNTAYMNPFYQAVRMLPNMPMYAPNGLPVSYNSNAGYVNPIASVQQSGYQKGIRNVLEGTANINFKVPGVEGLEMRLITSFDWAGRETKNWLTPYETMGRAREQVTGDFVYMTTVPGISKNSLRQSYSTSQRKTFQPAISYNRTFNEDHTVGLLAVYDYSRSQGNIFSAGASNLPITILQEIDLGSSDEQDRVAPTGSSNTPESKAGYIFRGTYGYKSRYLLEVANRWDASVWFPKNNRWQMFPAVGLGWVASDESFFKENVPFIDFFKVKASYGKTGNDRGVQPFLYLSTFSMTSSPVTVINGQPAKALFTGAPPNSGLRWETTFTRNIGFESNFLNGMFGFDFEWYYKHTKGILGSVGSLFPPSIGGYFPETANIGEVDNRGFDAQLRFNKSFGEFQMRLTGNLNWAKNQYLKLNEGDNIPSWQSLIGKPIGTKIGFIVDGMVQSWEEARNTPSPSAGIVAPGFFKYRDLNGDGRITRSDDMTYMGRPNFPELMYGLNIDLAYKGFDFSALLQGAGRASVNLAGTYEGSSGTSGVDDNSPFTRTFYGYGNSPYFLMENSWSPTNTDAEFPRMTAYKAQLSPHNAHKNSGWVRKGDYLRLKSVQIGYTLPKHWIGGAKLQQVRLYATGSNLLTFDYLKYLDPEMPNVNNGFYPQQRIYSFGLNVTF
ncbi:TonB-dependent receptor [Sphingobacterium psychroaquaticum]|uniref:SusC/RagA family TonB-linked outer membrane protein n=1 Tax=Sphingobacterium psychroaquaticum TaxID=561061 RepID=UPI00106D38A8|nr:TonB-dependent receptor [Sphingobacterium psychroaquaticum]QBQ42774.1 TonB-dependent receptor [Sphingobacterium psychroaquaticum]